MEWPCLPVCVEVSLCVLLFCRREVFNADTMFFDDPTDKVSYGYGHLISTHPILDLFFRQLCGDTVMDVQIWKFQSLVNQHVILCHLLVFFVLALQSGYSFGYRAVNYSFHGVVVFVRLC
ncbi:hypothetical protein R3W88_000913 [Solanum pinnatisectum]|uniref:Uncharacterized protein n=1 Tax=Solanum pinnatisectum TaxID=50273 RepID=A0AAV9MGP0_9SOLN|nr:hypothetical protein R3W88_000913 [Solanum pinnatisectum]